MWHAVGMKQTSDTAFEPDWLALREPADHAARDGALLAQAARCAGPDLRGLDLGSGTGSTVRAFEQAGFDGLKWRLFDNDAGLLSIAKDRCPHADCVVGNLADVEALPLDGVGLVTVSAVLDLMSRDWVTALVARLSAANLPFYGALNYDGAMQWTPTQEDDAAVTQLFNQHQRRDKGVGAALGPASGTETAALFRDQGYDVTLAQSPWNIGPDQDVLHGQLIDGIAGAVGELDAAVASEWRTSRRSALPNSSAVVGHTDILAVPRHGNIAKV